ncbi:replication initiator [Sporichthya polymorpha]|uniref:replication initiator n=1 Tax=Sporichthya polymorpha TaxID=35751 RepID=UPI000381C1C4|nr:replication initiator [Sporichthya polymorpha]
MKAIDPAMLRELAVAAKVCVRPVLLRCTDTETGAVATVPVPCGATVERSCPSCADRARRLRVHQCREGWHREDEPGPASGEDPLDENGADEPDGDEPHDDEPFRRTRSTRRRQDVADLPRVPMDQRTLGRAFRSADGRPWRPSMFLTLTLPSYGPVHPDGTPVDPDRYDYRRAALDALHFAKLEDRFWQNLRRCAGYKVQYFAAIEPQRRLAPHLHAAVRGVVPRQLVRQVVAATYHQLWWPPCDQAVFDEHKQPVWCIASRAYLDPATGQPLPTWDQALDDLDDDPAPRPAHVLRFGEQLDYQGLVGGDDDRVNRAVGYLTKYLTKDMSTTYADAADLTARQAEHLRRYHRQIRLLPCSPRCANWLRYGVQPKDAGPGLEIGRCPAKAHDWHHLGLGGRRVHVSRQWTGKTLAQHAADRAAVVAEVLAEAGMTSHDRQRWAATVTDTDGTARYIWTRIDPHDGDALTYFQAIAAAVRERQQWTAQYDAAKAIVQDNPSAA